MKKVQKDRKLEIDAGQLVFNQRKRLIHDRLRDEESTALDFYHQHLREIGERRESQQVQQKKISEKTHRQVRDTLMKQQRKNLDSRTGRVQFVTQEEFYKAVNDLGGLTERLQKNSLRHDQDLRNKSQQAKHLSMQAIQSIKKNTILQERRLEMETQDLHQSLERKMKAAKKYEKDQKQIQAERRDTNLEKLQKS